MEREVYSRLLMAWAGIAACVFIALQFLTAPYGRHARPGWGPTIHRTAGWVIMESPAVIVFAFSFASAKAVECGSGLGAGLSCRCRNAGQACLQ